VVSIPCIQKGEQLIAFVVETHPDKLLLNKKLDDLDLPKLSQPDHYASIDAIPMLPTGKVDYRYLKELATKKFTQFP
jgi:acyl-[acyl-carrier-protein]-phospholipid O-acyltransferase/long-chain-fatty-acid--[acyl-carrier-protein] ligase